MKRVVITGIGIVSPLGCTVDGFWSRLKAGTSAGRTITSFDPTNFDTKIACPVTEFEAEKFIDRKEARRMDPFSQFAVAASKMAVEQAGLKPETEDPERIGVLVSSGIGGLQILQAQHSTLREKGPGRCSPFMIPQMIANIAGGLVAIQHGFKGPNFGIVSACASGAHSIGEAQRIIQRGEADVMLAGGSEAAICELGVAGFCSMKAMSTRNDAPEKASRPFDLNRDGFVMGEGACVLVLEELERARARGAAIWCEVAGFGMTCDAFHITAPDESGDGAMRAMKLAMKDAGFSQVDYINAHGTSTPLNDKLETIAIKRVLGEEAARKVMISSTKSMTGHLLGAAGAVETAVCALAIRDGVIPPTINYETPDPACDLDYVPNAAREVKVRACLNNSLGFGGHNACLALKAME